MSQDNILVLGATGRQGGAVARHLLADGWQVRAFVRDPASMAARGLERAGATLVRGDLDDDDSLRTAMAGVHGVFSVQTFMGPGGIPAEVRQGKAVAYAAAEVGIGHLVYCSVGGAERNSGVPHFESKWAIEQAIDHLKLPATILRPTFFMENLTGYGGPSLVDGTVVVRQALRPDTALQLIAVDDIGAFVARVFSHPKNFIGARLELAGDEMTGPQMASKFGELTGLPSRFEQLPIDEIRAVSDDFAAMYDFFNDRGFQANIAFVRTWHPQLTSLKTWVRENAAALPGILPAGAAV